MQQQLDRIEQQIEQQRLQQQRYPLNGYKPLNGF
jgi:hypothetical protein